MTFCEEVREETNIYWKGSFEHPLILKLADGSLYGSNEYKEKIDYQIKMMNRYANYTDKQKHHKLKEFFAKSCYYEWMFWEMAMTKQSWIPEEVKSC